MKYVETGEVYKFKDSRDLYIVSVLDISRCGMYTLLNIQTGEIGPLWDDRQEMVKNREFVASNITELLE